MAPPNPGISSLRGEYVSEADPLGSVPPPATAKGMMKTGMAAMMGESPQMFLDKLAERLAFERTGARLYDQMADEFAQALEHEREHLLQVRAWVEEGLLENRMVADPQASTGAAATGPLH